jgi:hypothetical protein
MVATEARKRVIISAPTVVSLELVAPAACSSSGSLFDPVSIAGAVSTAGGSASGVSVAGVADAGVAEGVAVAADGASPLAGAAGVVAGGEVSVPDGVAAAGAVLSPAASAECHQERQLSFPFQVLVVVTVKAGEVPCVHTVAGVGQVADVGDHTLRLAEEHPHGAGRELGRGAEAGRLDMGKGVELVAARLQRGRAHAEDVADARGQAERRRRAAGQRWERPRRLLRRGQRRRRDDQRQSRLEPPPGHDSTLRLITCPSPLATIGRGGST